MVKDKLSDTHSQHLIMENMAEENGNYEEADLAMLEAAGVKRSLVSGVPHKVLIKHFLNVTGVTEEMLSEASGSIGAAFTKDMLDLYESANACEALAVIGFAIEQTVPTLYQFIWDGLKRSPMAADDYVFFPLHILVDDGHSDLLKGAFAREWAKDPAQCQHAEALVYRVLDRRTQMFADVRALTESVTGHTCGLPKVDTARLHEAQAAVERISTGVTNHYLVNHDFLQCFASGDLGDTTTATRIFATNHYSYSKNFIRYRFTRSLDFKT